MKILVLTDMFPSKENPVLGIFVHGLSEVIARKNQVVVIHPQIWNPLNVKSYRTDNHSPCTNDIKVYRPRLFVPPKGDRLFFRAIVFFFSALFLIIKLRKQFNFDIIHAHMACPAGFAAVLLGRVFKKPVIVTAHGSDIHSFPKRFFLRHLIFFTLNKANKVVTVSNSLKELVLKMGISQKKLSVIRNGVLPEKFFQFDKIKAREKLNLSTNKKIILFIGNLIPIKGIDILLHSFSKIGERNHIGLIIIGNGASERELMNLTKELRIESHVSFAGIKNHDEIPLWLNACDVFCLPSYIEGFPAVVVEAIACGRPVVATNVGGISEVITNESFGILVEPGNKEELALALSNALEKKWDYQAIAAYGKRFSWDTIAEEYIKLYKSL